MHHHIYCVYMPTVLWLLGLWCSLLAFAVHTIDYLTCLPKPIEAREGRVMIFGAWAWLELVNVPCQLRV